MYKVIDRTMKTKRPYFRLIYIAGACAVLVVAYFSCTQNSRTRSVRVRQLEDCLFEKDAGCLLAFTPEHERLKTPITADTYRKLFDALDWDAVIDVEASRATSKEVPISARGWTVRSVQLTFKDGRSALYGFALSGSEDDSQVSSILPSLLASYFRAKYLKDPETAGYKRFEAYRRGFGEYGERLRQCGIMKLDWDKEFRRLEDLDAYFTQLIEEAESRESGN